MKIKYFYIVTYYSLFLLIFLITSGCESQLHQEQSRVKEFHQEAQLVETQQTLLRWFYWVESKPMQLAKTYQNHTELFSLPTLQLVDKIFQQTKQPEQITELRAFKNYLQNEYINREIAAKEDTIRSIRSSAQFAFNGKNYVLKDVKQLLSGSLSKEEADKLFETILPKLQKLSSLRMSIDRQRTEVAQTLEFPSHIELASSIYYFSPTHIHQHAIELLSQTNSLYRSLLSQLTLTDFNLPPDSVRLSQLFTLIRNHHLPQTFPAHKSMSAVTHFLQGLGIYPTRQSHLHIHAKDTAEKMEGVYCAVVDAPEDVRFSIKPESGYQHYRDVFHQMGYAQFALYTKNESAVLQHLYDSPVQEIFALLFANIWEDSSWVNESFDLSEEEHAKLYQISALSRLIKLRMEAATIRYEMNLREGSTDSLALFRQYITRALGVSHSPAEASWIFYHRSDYAEAANFLNASILEALLRDYLIETYGQHWYRNSRCGKYLKSLWKRGNGWTFPAFIKKMEIKELSLEPLVNSLHQLVKRSNTNLLKE